MSFLTTVKKELKQCGSIALLEATFEAYVESTEYKALTPEEQGVLDAYFLILESELANSIEEDYPSYDHTKFKVASKAWGELNPDNLSYWNWLHEVAMPRFWVQSKPELQYKLMAICCAINSSAIPAWNHSARKEAQLPILYFYGESGSGKTEGNKLIAQSYSFARWALYKADSSGCSLRNSFHRLSHKAESELGWDAHLYPAFVVLDNYEPRFMDKWAEYKTMLLSVIRSQSFCQIANKDGGNNVYWGHLLKSFTSVVHPKAMDRAGSEFYRRFVFFYTSKNSVQSMGNWDFSDVPTIYRELWSPDNVYARFYPILQNLLQKNDDSTTIPFHRWQQTVVLLATGVYVGIFSSIDEGVEFFTEYWKWIEWKEDQTSSSIDIVMSKIVDEALEYHHKAFIRKKTIADPYPVIDLEAVLPRVRKLLPEVKFLEKMLVGYLTLHEWSYVIKGDKPYYELKKSIQDLYPLPLK